MKTGPWLKISAAVLLTFALAALVRPAAAAPAGEPPQTGIASQDLAERYVPVLYLHGNELFRPQPVEVMLDTARLQQARSLWSDVRLLNRVTSSALQGYSDDRIYLNAWLGDEVSSDYKNYTSHRAYYQSALSPEAGGPSPVAYAHVTRGGQAQHITIQYWLFYWYNDAFNKHEGDWEMVQVELSPAGEPEWLILSQHHGGTRRPWSAARIEDGTHPAVYVALGSHANYFWGDEVYLSVQTIGNARVEVADRTGTAGRTIPAVVLIPDREEVRRDPTRWAGFEWLLFQGGWGERAPQRDFSGPVGPADKGEQWEDPHAWGMAQPLDTDEWYANRLRVEVSSQTGGSAQVTLRGAVVSPLTADETPDGIALLHTDPPTATAIMANIDATPNERYDIVATLPDAAASRVVEYRFDDVALGAIGRATLALPAGGPPLLRIDGNTRGERPVQPGSPAAARGPTAVASSTASWNAPDVMWAIGLLSLPDVVAGLGLSLLAGLLPPLVYVALLYWADQYEKEPVRLLVGAFLWGSLPALLISAIVRIFFRLPPSLVGPGAIQLVSNAFVSPVIDEVLTGGVVLFIAWRYWREFDGVLDGVIYGAIAGLGFAMTANIAGYLGAFVQYGFGGLGHMVFVDGFLYGLNQAMYAAIFGAGLGYVRLARRRWHRWAVPLAAFVLAVATRAFHNLAIDNAIGWNLWTLAVTWAGWLVLLAVMAWSLREQRRCLADELAGEVPEALYRRLAMPGGCWLAEARALWRGGLPGLVRTRRALQVCAALAFEKASDRRLGRCTVSDQVGRLREELQPLLADALRALAA